MVPSDVSGCSIEIKVQWSNNKLEKWWMEDRLLQASKLPMSIVNPREG